MRLKRIKLVQNYEMKSLSDESRENIQETHDARCHLHCFNNSVFRDRTGLRACL